MFKRLFAIIGFLFCLMIASISLMSAVVAIGAGIFVLLNANILGFIMAIIMCAGTLFITALSIIGGMACLNIEEN